MKETANIFKVRPILACSLSLLVLMVCIYPFMLRHDSNLSIFVAISALIFFISLKVEVRAFLLESLKKQKSNLLILCILLFGGIGLIFQVGNIEEVGFFLILFFSFYLIFKSQVKILNNFIFNLVIFSGILVSLGILMGLIESIFLPTRHFYHVYDGYAYLDQKLVYSGFSFNHNSSAYIIIIAQSFLFLSTSSFAKRLRNFLTLLFLTALLVSAAKIVFLFMALVAINYFVQHQIRKNLLILGLITMYLLLAHTVIALSNSYEIGSIHYQKILFSFRGFDLVLGIYGHLKEVYFLYLSGNFFFPMDIEGTRFDLNSYPHSLIFSSIMLGGLPLFLTLFLFLVNGIYKNFKLIEERTSIYFFSGLIAIIVESIVWDAYDSLFFWIIITYAITFSKDYLITKEGSRAIT